MVLQGTCPGKSSGGYGTVSGVLPERSCHPRRRPVRSKLSSAFPRECPLVNLTWGRWEVVMGILSDRSSQVTTSRGVGRYMYPSATLNAWCYSPLLAAGEDREPRQPPREHRSPRPHPARGPVTRQSPATPPPPGKGRGSQLRASQQGFLAS